MDVVSGLRACQRGYAKKRCETAILRLCENYSSPCSSSPGEEGVQSNKEPQDTYLAGCMNLCRAFVIDIHKVSAKRVRVG
ncbi:hypothetical protein PR048_020946 [Dryococelus australis]|uniref:Uncharacterized protein n=1 Tax=Dryococelus australis TaxID=614101 RepID=A0ABQ9GWY3_9NEOP|nr:hypothetical protein PR048_020946 [Dryococelus australis]